MSYVAQKWAWKQQLPYKLKIVYLAIAEYADANGEAFPKIPALAKKCGASRWTVMEASAALVQRGLLVVESGKDSKGQQRRNLYRLVMQPSSQQLPSRVASSYNPSSQQLPAELPAATRHIRKEPVTGNRSHEPVTGNGHSNSQRRLAIHAAEKGNDITVVPKVDDAELRGCVVAYIAGRGPTMHPLYGHVLEDGTLRAWDAIKNSDHGDIPDDIVGTFCRVLKLYADDPELGQTRSSFRSILERAHKWDADLDAESPF